MASVSTQFFEQGETLGFLQGYKEGLSFAVYDMRQRIPQEDLSGILNSPQLIEKLSSSSMDAAPLFEAHKASLSEKHLEMLKNGRNEGLKKGRAQGYDHAVRQIPGYSEGYTLQAAERLLKVAKRVWERYSAGSIENSERIQTLRKNVAWARAHAENCTPIGVSFGMGNADFVDRKHPLYPLFELQMKEEEACRQKIGKKARQVVLGESLYRLSIAIGSSQGLFTGFEHGWDSQKERLKVNVEMPRDLKRKIQCAKQRNLTWKALLQKMNPKESETIAWRDNVEAACKEEFKSAYRYASTLYQVEAGRNGALTDPPLPLYPLHTVYPGKSFVKLRILCWE